MTIDDIRGRLIAQGFRLFIDRDGYLVVADVDYNPKATQPAAERELRATFLKGLDEAGFRWSDD